MTTPILAAQHAAYVQTRSRLFNGNTPPERPRRIIAVRRQPHHPDYAEPAPVLPYVVNPQAVQETVRDIISVMSEEKAHLPDPEHWRDIVEEVCAKHCVTAAELFSIRRARHIVKARQEAMYRLSVETSMSLPAIGRKMGNRDHTTVIYGIRSHEARMRSAVYRPKYRLKGAAE